MKRSTAGAFAFYQKRSIAFSGGHREDVTPVPIPNTEVKSLIGEGTARFAGGRVARCRVFTELDSERSQALFFVFRRHVAREWAFFCRVMTHSAVARLGKCGVLR